MRILVLAPHPDDETIGCGGTLLLHHARRDRITVAFLTSGELGLKHLPADEARRIRETEAREAAPLLGCEQLHFLRLPDWGGEENLEAGAAALAPLLLAEPPELVFVPHEADEHPDHAVAIPMLRKAIRNASAPAPWVLAYEVWTPLQRHDHVEDITEVLDRKLQALRCYPSQLASFSYDRAVVGLSQYRGALAAKCAHAEVFQTVVVD